MRKRFGRWIAIAAAISMAVSSMPLDVLAANNTTGLKQGKADQQESIGAVRTKKDDTEEALQVVFSKESGMYADAFQLDLSFADQAAEIYYTTDGSDPSDPENENRIAYGEGGIQITDRKSDENVLSAIDPILFDAVNVKVNSDRTDFVSTVNKPSKEAVDKCTVVKAAAQYADGTCSGVTTNTYFVGDMESHIQGIQGSCKAAGKDLAVMSISMDADDLFDSTKGIYVKGDVFQKALESYLAKNKKISRNDAVNISRKMDANYKQKGKDWERSTHIDYFESDGTDTKCQLQQDCGIRIQGNYSRSDYQKSFRLYAREDYGSKNFKYGFWDNATDDEGNVIKKYKKIVLRNGGNCAFTTKFSDSYWQSLLENLDCDNQSSRPCVVYLNGEYWGVYILQDDFNGAYMENKHGVNKDNVVIYKGDAEAIKPLGYKLDEGELPEGETQENYYLQDLENFMRTHSSVSTQEDYDQLAAMVDEDSIIDYFATEVWINNKWDWPGKNWSIWKSTQTDDQNTYADGKWRFLIYDVEFGGVSGSSDVWGNALENSNLLETGTDDEGSINSDKPHVRCFALMMTNKAFRDKFVAKLESFSSGMFEYDRLMNRADLYKSVYQPILPQFFDRFPTGATVEDAIYGNYASWKTIVDFAEKRAEKIPDIVQYVRNYYGDKEEEPSAAPSQTETAAPAAPSQSAMPSETGVPSQSEVPASSNVPPASQTPLQSSVPAPTTAASPSPNAQVPGDQPATQAPSKMQGEKTEKLKDGTVKISKTGQNGKVISTEYRKAGISYRVKKNQTLSCGTADPKLLKKQRSLVIKDTIRLDGKNWKITEIRTNGFKGLNKLERVTVGSNITKIGNGAFQKCGRLKKIMIKGKKLSFLGKNAIKGIYKKTVIHCPKTKKKAYGKILSKKTGFDKKTMKLK